MSKPLLDTDGQKEQADNEAPPLSGIFTHQISNLWAKRNMAMEKHQRGFFEVL